jgi:hypothetical protein
MPPHIYNHILLYIVFLRILTQDFISENDIEEAQELIVLFSKDFELLYGVEKVTFNLHGHLHLASQVKMFGPLNKISAFPFEGMFNYTGKFKHGTRALVRQIANGVELDKYILFQSPSEIDRIKNHCLRSFLKDIKKKKQNNFAAISFDYLSDIEQNALRIKISDIRSKQV